MKKRSWTFAYLSGLVEKDEGVNVGGKPILSAENPVFEATSAGYGRNTSHGLINVPVRPDEYPDQGVDPLVWMAGHLEFVQAGVKKGAATFSISFRWYINWPMMLKSTFTREIMEQKWLTLEGVGDDYGGKQLKLSPEETVRVRRKPVLDVGDISLVEERRFDRSLGSLSSLNDWLPGRIPIYLRSFSM